MKKIVSHDPLKSPFEQIKHVDEQGEYWLAREMQELMGYKNWREFHDTIEKAQISCQIAGQAPSDHFVHAPKMVKLGSGAKRKVDDYRFTRYACYLVAMNGDVRKEEVANSQTYFAAQTYFAENVQAGISTAEQKPFLNTLWTRRAMIFNEKTRIPEGYWCIFNEIGHICWQYELKDIHLTEESTPDISVGQLWAKYARSIGKDMSLARKYNHHYPPGDKRGVQQAYIYPNAWYGDFRDWFQKQYLKVEFKKYLATHMLINGELPQPKTPNPPQIEGQ